jgi:hypothetical protein
MFGSRKKGPVLPTTNGSAALTKTESGKTVRLKKIPGIGWVRNDVSNSEGL